MQKVNLAKAFEQIPEYWNPRIAAEVNDVQVKLARVKGEFDWHHHPDGDELFFVVRGHLELQFRDRTIGLAEGEFLVVPRGVEHRPVAKDEVQLLLIEPKGTLNTGTEVTDRTVESPEWI